MSSLVYLPAVNDQSWLHWSHRGEASCLRLYTQNGVRRVGPRTTREVQRRLDEHGAKQEPAPRVPHDRIVYWQETIRLRNIESGFVNEADCTQRLLAVFLRELNQAWAHLNEDDIACELHSIVDRWISGLSRANDWAHQINHWDGDAAQHLVSPETGIGWESYFLEACRNGGQPRFMDVDHRQVFFAAMEASFGIPEAQNLLVPRRQGSVKPDGLGVDNDGNVVVFEIKGPQDVLDPLLAVVQGVLGALAVYAKRDCVVRLLRQRHQLRPEVQNAAIDDKTASLIVNVLLSTGNPAPRVTNQVDRMIRQLLSACGMIREIAVLRINQATRQRFTRENLNQQLPWLPQLVAANAWCQEQYCP